MKGRQIGVCPAGEYWHHQRLFDALALLHPIQFVPVDVPSGAGLDGILLFNRTPDAAAAMAQAGLSVCHFTTEGNGVSSAGCSEVVFSSRAALDPSLRGRKLEDSDLDAFCGLTPAAGDEVIATKGGAVFWLRRAGGGVSLNRVGVAPPELGAGECLWHHFHAGRFARLLPLLHFLREVVGNSGWNSGPLRAAFIFDDPDLSRSRYGCIDFTGLARHATQHGYHVAIAVVPLTAGRVDRNLAGLFRAHPRQLSLVIHGNDHTYYEMLRLYSEPDALTILAQALRRIERMEQCFGLEVSRVLEPPHQALSLSAFPAMTALGYEAVVATRERMLQHNPQMHWPPESGLDIAEVMPCGLGVIPRICMSAQWRTEVVLAAFLRKPVILAGHHQDAGGGLELLAEFAQLVNGFGLVEWGSLATMARSGFKTRQEGNLLRIKTYQRRVSVRIPEGVEQMAVERPWLRTGGEDALIVESEHSVAHFNSRAGEFSPVFAVRPSSTVVIRSPAPNARDPRTVPKPALRLWPYARRFLTETRDRVYPLLKRGTRRPRPQAAAPSQQHNANASPYIGA